MEVYPEELDLIWLFEAEPELANPDLPWVYNAVRFSTTRDGNEVEFDMEPGNGLASIIWRQGGVERTRAELEGVWKVEVWKEEQGEGLSVLTYSEVHVVLWLKPEVRLTWRAGIL